MKKHIKHTSLVLVFAIMCVACVQKENRVNPEDFGISVDNLDLASEKMQSFIEDGSYPFIGNIIVKDGKVVVKQTYGFNDPEKREPLREDAIYRVYSMSKPITAAALMILYDEGKFNLDDPVYNYIPWFEHTKVHTPEGLVPQERPMTITNLLTHTSGLTYGWDPDSYVDSLYRVYQGEMMWGENSLAEVVELLASIPLKHQPGTHYEYSYSIDVAGYLVEVLSGMGFDAFLSERIFRPLKMNETGFFVPEEKKDQFTRMYYRGQDGSLNTPDETEDDVFLKKPVMFSGGGGLVSTMDDYARFAMMLLNGGELEGTRILKEETVKLIRTDHLPEGVEGWDGGYGLGGSVDPETGDYGWGGAASTAFVMMPQHNMAVMSFTQLMPADYSYSNTYLEMVKKAVTEQVRDQSVNSKTTEHLFTE